MELKLARQIARLTQAQLSERSGVAPATISRLENDNRHYGSVAYEDIVRLARALNADCEELFPVPDLPVSSDIAVNQ